jgi:hypothetical protein
LAELVYFHQLIRNGRTIDREERLIAPRGKRMDDLCDQPFPRPNLALDQDWDVCGRSLFDNLLNPIKFAPQNVWRDSHLTCPKSNFLPDKNSIFKKHDTRLFGILFPAEMAKIWKFFFSLLP